MLLKKAAKASHCALRASTYALSVCGGISLIAGAISTFQLSRIEEKSLKIGSKLHFFASDWKPSTPAYIIEPKSALPEILVSEVPVQNKITFTVRKKRRPEYVFSSDLFASIEDDAVLSGIEKSEVQGSHLAPDLEVVLQEYEAEEEGYDHKGLREILAHEVHEVSKPAFAGKPRHDQPSIAKISLNVEKKKHPAKKPERKVNLDSQTVKPVNIQVVSIEKRGPPAKQAEREERVVNQKPAIQELETESKLGYSDLVAMFSNDDVRQTLSDGDPIQIQPMKLPESSKPEALLALAEIPAETTKTRALDNQPVVIQSMITQVPSDAKQQPVPTHNSTVDERPAANAKVSKPSSNEKEASAISAVAREKSATPAPVEVPERDFRFAVVDAFMSDRMPLSDVSAQVLGAPLYASAFGDGESRFERLAVQGVLPVVVTKEGYLGRRVDLKMEDGLQEVALISENSAKMLGEILGEAHRSGTGIVSGIIESTNGTPLAGLQVSLFNLVHSQEAYGAKYFSEAGVPNKDYIVTESNGQFVILNVSPGTYLMTLRDLGGREYASRILHVNSNEGIFRRFSVGVQKTIVGRVLNATANRTVGGAKVQLLGQTLEVETAKNGAFTIGPLFVDCSELNYLQIRKDGYYVNRVDYACDPYEKLRNVLIVPSSAVDGDAADAGLRLDERTGAVMGHVSLKEKVRVQLWGADEVQSQQSFRGKDFYYGRDGVLRSHLDSTTDSGRFALFDAPVGLSYIQTVSKNGDFTLSYWPIMISPSTVNVYLQ